MIQVTINHNENRHVASFEMKGHADFDESGKDLVCAGASAVAFGAVNAMYEILKVEPTIQQKGEGGYLHVTLPTNLDEELDSRLQLIVQTMVAQLYTIVQSYGQFIQISYSQM
ncbi:ribosomal-processing cysteine protease Prp [Viridibacillus sp. YIM B01967]|uniref:Ribosomal processing cysteine protease Prp n=1 Tax=Viridibacillus soli TaxID=2798301 RepID=A0ABS1H1Y9_9BACL|nr:ribosomal-processing cysteine protease Prp [Viridibacillus soli]MBK3493427.1 ribosomal-processing cysteine protease Prp [Viridibacillus soli]